MSGLRDSVRFARDEEIKDPLLAGMMAAAVSIMYEDPSTPNHEMRAQLAVRVLRDPLGNLSSFLWAVATNSTVVAKWVSGDRDGALEDLGFVISTVWNPIAGVGNS